MNIRTVLMISVLLFLSACGSISHKKPTSHTTSIKPVRITNIDQLRGGQELVLNSMSLIGMPYRYGGSTRDSGFDCSGLVQYVYQSALGVRLPRTAKDIATSGMSINKNRLKIGDLVFFNTTGAKYSHVGIYIGDNQFIHSPNSRSVIKIENLNHTYYSKRYTGARTFFTY